MLKPTPQCRREIQPRRRAEQDAQLDSVTGSLTPDFQGLYITAESGRRGFGAIPICLSCRRSLEIAVPHGCRISLTEEKFRREPLEVIRWQIFQQPEKFLTHIPHTHEEDLRFNKMCYRHQSSPIV